MSFAGQQEIGQSIGTAKVTAQDISLSAKNIGFYAVAYRWEDKVGIEHDVISYRGTNPDFNSSLKDFIDSPIIQDAWNGWRLVGGYDQIGQAQLALSFAEQVLNIKIDGTAHDLASGEQGSNTTTVEFLGHSLGGGLAGFVNSLAKVGGSQTTLYDHMPFELAAWMNSYSLAFEKTCQDFSLDTKDTATALTGNIGLNIVLGSSGTRVTTAREFITTLAGNLNQLAPAFGGNAIHVNDEALSYLRDGSPLLIAAGGTLVSASLATVLTLFGFQKLGADLSEFGTQVSFGTATSSELDQAAYPNQSAIFSYENELSAVQKHSMALLAILEYAEKQWPSVAGKHNANDWIATASDLMPAIIDTSIGKAIGLDKGKTGTFDAGAQMASMIAYSAIDIGERPFGDTGIRALFDDASDLGRAQYAAWRPQALVNADKDLAKLAVEYAGLLAFNKVMAADDTTATGGVLRYLNANAMRAETLTVDLRAKTWTKGDSQSAHTPSVHDALVADVLGGIDAHTLAKAEAWYGAIGHPGATIAGDVDQLTFALTAGLKAGSLPGASAATGLAVSVLSDGGNTMDADVGRDMVIGGAGDDIIYGGGFSHVLIGGNGYDEVHGGTGNDLLIAGDGWDTLYGDAGADTFLFDGSSSGAILVGGAGNDTYDLRGSHTAADIFINKGDGRDKILTDADAFKFAELKFTADNQLPEVPMHQIRLHLPDRCLADIQVVWTISVADTHRVNNDTIELVYGHILVQDKATKSLILDMGIYAGTKTYHPGYTGYEFSDPRGPFIELKDGLFGSIGDGIWPDMLV